MNTKLKYRHELKFVINIHQYFIIRQRLRNLIKLDEHAGKSGEYHIRSLYFDDMDSTALYEKLSGVRDRNKYRIRIYNKSDFTIHFEKKIKLGNYIAKMKEPLTRDMYNSILTGDYEVLNQPDKPFMTELYRQLTQNLLRPKVIVDYVREPYICRNGNVRITFDKELRTGLNAVDIFDPNLSPILAIDDNLIILEVKYDEYLPDYIRSVIQLDGLIQQSTSKYVICCKYLKTNSWEDQ